MVVFYFFDKEGIITKKQYIVFHWISRKKKTTTKTCQLMTTNACTLNTNKKNLRRSGHVIDDFMFLFWSLKYYQVKHCFPVNIHCRAAKRQLSTVLGLVFRLFRLYLFPTSSSVNSKCPKSLVISVYVPRNKTSNMLLFSTQ